MVKRILSIFVLTIFLAHFAGFYIYFVFQINKNHHEMRMRLRALPVEQLELITLSSEQFEEAREDEYEIEFEGKMYDIARLEKQGDRILAYCLHDETEDSILAFLDKVLTSPLNGEQTPTSLTQFFSLTYLPMFWNFSAPQFSKPKCFTAYQEVQSSLCKENIAPPPKI